MEEQSNGVARTEGGELRKGVSRRGFLQRAGITAAGLGAGVAGLQCADDQDEAQIDESSDLFIPDQHEMYGLNVAPAPFEHQPVPDVLLFFTPDEYDTVEAIMARLLPGTPDDPGATEAGVARYIDIKLSAFEGFWQPTYREAPYTRTYTGDPPPSADANGFDGRVIWVSEDEIDRYGFQSILTPREIYRLGLASTNSYAMREFGSSFTDLSNAQQDQVLTAMEEDEADGFNNPGAEEFFTRLRDDLIEGMFSDPAYGGNRDMVGWRLLDYPGAQRGYTPVDMHTEMNNREPQSLAMLHGFNAGDDRGPNAIIPLQSAQRGESGQLSWFCNPTEEDEHGN